MNRNHNFKYKLAKGVSGNDTVSGQKLYDILSQYTDCLKTVQKISEEHETTFKNDLESFRIKHTLNKYQGLNKTEDNNIKTKIEDDEDNQHDQPFNLIKNEQQPEDVVEQMKRALDTRTYVSLM